MRTFAVWGADLDRRGLVAVGALLGDEQVGVGRVGPALVAVGEVALDGLLGQWAMLRWFPDSTASLLAR
ncbi:hypothetical protein GCM10027569_25290 [Flindersiella endophytica]